MKSRLGFSRPVVLTFVRYYLPGYKSGGPVRTIANLVAALGDELDFRIVTSDRDATDTMPYPHLDGRSEWLDVRKAKVLYLSPSQMKLRNIARIIGEVPHETLYLNSFFDPIFTLKPLLARRLGLAPRNRCIVAPRGEFSPAALDLKAAKKRVFLAVSRGAGLYRDLIWQASSEHEAGDIGRTIGGIASDIRVSANLSAQVDGKSEFPHRPREQGEPLRICFLSRISPMKNLDFALEVLRKVRASVRFDIYGLVDDQDYWKICQNISSILPNNISTSYLGIVDHEDVLATLSRYDLFFLPTRGENYGHAIIESLAAGTPVLITDSTPWRDLSNKGIGWDLPLDDGKAFAHCIDYVSALSQEECKRSRDLAVAFFREHQKSLKTIADNRALFTRPTGR
ncbi:glycosyltransferase [Pseudaminobacter soli (ex Li et al. 2025)]|uniref:glycosyltransferase n=1 Tax=Pseudaminobacter soli (ex Li et al. 2025) TaxID=1295366 RepID=UPI0015E721F3|nr:glycosyltransferase [Mesorhizobium soli]